MKNPGERGRVLLEVFLQNSSYGVVEIVKLLDKFDKY
jgi:hypothetical protein